MNTLKEWLLVASRWRELGKLVKVGSLWVQTYSYNITEFWWSNVQHDDYIYQYCIVCAVLSHSVMSDSATSWAVAHQAPLSMGIIQTRILEWVAMPSSRGSSQPRNQTQVFHNACRFFTAWATKEAQEYWSGYPFWYPFSRGSSWPRSPTRVSYVISRSFTSWDTREYNCYIIHIVLKVERE